MEQYAAMNEQLHNYSLWEQDYYSSGETGMLSHGFSETNDFSTNFFSKNMPFNPDRNFPINADVARNDFVSSPETANPGTSPGKSKRRRSKGGAAAAQSTTFLNASITNFRALVQQHTGCHNTTSSPKGPITLCFGAPSSSQETIHHHHHQYYYA